MKIGLFIILHFLFISFMFSQTIIKGKLKTADNKPLEGASVYLNNTTIGIISNKEGEFLLKAKNGNYNLIISYLGYTTIQKSVNANSETIILNFTLKPDNTVLNEVVIKKTKYDADWKYNLTRFKQAFLGRTKLADKCEILNRYILNIITKPKV
ncbi:carboxypeptidase-like regulatory domain-containing protein [Tenacibaculum haliotis]|uniref:carboxypeptidase-like regulatory domain-containing protein n=1 Tax=Tenacibaculum haliotis TaxID=1888914 RepID=UPI0021B02F03|nr:carboxypeptidase-like regulatory domain-containing protein [Tenacibaculum haliotis]MCT4699091.1 carboxypeptidase-like regulatory domain-containing protein [Tenacibaculum haliotis]